MKKTMFSLLMLAAMFMVASCGSKSNSGEATEATQEQVKEVTFTDPAITYDEGLDLTSYFLAESFTKPGLKKRNDIYGQGYWYISTSIKLKVLKKLNVKRKSDFSGVTYKIKFCDENGSPIASGNEKSEYATLCNWSEGTVVSIDVMSHERETEMHEDEMKELLSKIAKIEISIGTDRLEFLETEESQK